MFVFLFRAGGGITSNCLWQAGQALNPANSVYSWISPDSRIGVVWASAAMLKESGTAKFKSNEPFVLAHGRLDAPEEIRAYLHSDRTADDAHLIALTVLRKGELAPNFLYGDYAFAHWTGKALFIATDPIGQKPLYYTQTKNGFAVATRLPALLALPDTSRELDFDGLALLTLGRQGRNKGHTAFAHIRTLLGGYSAWLHPGREIKAQRWWRPDLVIRRNYKDPRDYTAELDALFKNAVSSRLSASGNVGCSLSGGLDSTLVASFAAPVLSDMGRVLHAWTSVPHPKLIPEQRHGWDSNDWNHASELTCLYSNIRHQPISPEGVCLLDVLQAVHTKSATPVRNSANHLWLTRIALRAQQAGCSVVLNGGHGNAGISFAGYGGIKRMCYRGHWGRVARHLQQISGNRWRYLFRELTAGFIDGVMLEPIRRMQGKRPPPIGFSLFQPAAQTLFIRRPLDVRRVTTRAKWAKFIARGKSPFSADFLAYANVEMRDPTADRRLHEYLLSCSPDAFVGDGFERLQARLLGANRVPDSIRWRRSRGEQAPEEAGYFTLYPDRYRAAWEEVRRLPWTKEYIHLASADKALEDLINGRIGVRAVGSVMHRILDVGLFVMHANRYYKY